jgi:hypothetical protein
VDYDAPVLNVTLPGGAKTVTLSGGTGRHLDIAVPMDSASGRLAEDLGHAESLPVLAGNPLDGLLARARGAAGGAAPETSTDTDTDTGTGTGPETGGLGLPAVPGLPVLGDLTGGLLGGGTERRGGQVEPARQGGGVLMLRLAIGDLVKNVTGEGLHAKAASLRIQLIVRSKWRGHDGGNDDGVSIADLGLGLIEAAAAAPRHGFPPPPGPGGGYGHDDHDDDDRCCYGGGALPDESPSATPSATPNTATPGTPAAGGGLPLTGTPLALIIGGGTGLAVVGRALMLLARRRTTPVPDGLD